MYRDLMTTTYTITKSQQKVEIETNKTVIKPFIPWSIVGNKKGGGGWGRWGRWGGKGPNVQPELLCSGQADAGRAAGCLSTQPRVSMPDP